MELTEFPQERGGGWRGTVRVVAGVCVCVPDSFSLRFPGGRFASPDLLMGWLRNAGLSTFTGKCVPGALRERMLWVEIVSFNLSRLDYLISVVLFPETSFYKCGFQNHFNLTLSWKSLSQAPSVGKCLQLWFGVRRPSSQMRRSSGGDWYALGGWACSKCELRLAIESLCFRLSWPLSWPWKMPCPQGSFLVSWFRKN